MWIRYSLNCKYFFKSGLHQHSVYVLLKEAPTPNAITYLPIKHGFLYLTAVVDWYSRCIVGWEVDDTLDTKMVITALKKAFMVAKPVILNSDQGCQFTSNEYMNYLKENHVRQSMDGKSRWADNIMIERWFRCFKY